MDGSPAEIKPFAYPGRWILGMALLFAAVHAAYYALGITFNRKTLIEVMHFLDPELLRANLLQSLWYLHIQPPLLNLFTGLVLKITPEATWLFQAIFLALGFILYLSTFFLQLRLGVNQALAALLSTLFMASPSFLLWEHFLFYTMPCATLLALAAVLLFDVLDRGRTWAIAGFFLALFLLCGMRSMFHLGYFALLWIALAILSRKHRKRVLLIGLLPFLVLFAGYFKNLLLFHEFNTCTFFEKNLWIMTAGNMGWDEKNEWVREGKLSPLSLVNRWASLDAYPPEFRKVPPRFAHVPALTQTHKSTGAVNYNHYGNIGICNIYGKDARYVLFHRPKAFLAATAMSWYRYFVSSSALPVSPENQQHIKPIIACYDYLFYGKWPFSRWLPQAFLDKAGYPPYLFLLLGLPLVLAYGLYRLLRPNAGPCPLNKVQHLVVLFLCFNILVVAVLGCTFDFHEAARYRFSTDAFSLALLGLLLTAAFARKERSTPPQETPSP